MEGLLSVFAVSRPCSPEEAETCDKLVLSLRGPEIEIIPKAEKECCAAECGRDVVRSKTNPEMKTGKNGTVTYACLSGKRGERTEIGRRRAKALLFCFVFSVWN